jgi:hypothetical protein
MKKDPDVLARWSADLDLYLQIQTSMIKSLKHSTGVSQLELRRIERSLPTPYMVLNEGVGLDDPRLVELLPESMQEETVQELPLEKP